MSDLINGWHSTKIKDIGEIITGGTPPTENESYYGGDIPFISPADFHGQRVVRESNKKLSSKGLDKIRKIPPRSIMVTCIASVGKMGMSNVECATNQQINSIVCNSNYFPEFVYYKILNSQRELQLLTAMTAVPIINKTTFEEIRLIFPPFIEQKKIAEILNSVDRVIELTSMEIDKLKDLKKGVMQELLTKGIGHTKFKDSPAGKIPDGWSAKRLEDVCAKITDGTHDTPKVLNEGVPFITGKHIRDSFIDFDNCDYVSQNEHDTIYKRCNPEKGDVIYVNIGAGTATPAYIEIEKQFSMKNIALLKPNNKVLDGRFLEISLLHNKYKVFSQNINGGAQPFLGLKTIGEIQIAIPDISEQIQISKIVHSIELNIKSKNDLFVALSAVKKGLMNDLLTGKVRVNV